MDTNEMQAIADTLMSGDAKPKQFIKAVEAQHPRALKRHRESGRLLYYRQCRRGAGQGEEPPAFAIAERTAEDA
ncbi:hypothetical protein [Mesorhizobium sp.]|uniref:hypothetical protein n=1 Tax=Mesorhizobium sp. TaxID=1871066 RepID=UPI0025C54C47|nr:hypothetical protein [Mesorhizobium sp.]